MPFPLFAGRGRTPGISVAGTQFDVLAVTNAGDGSALVTCRAPVTDVVDDDCVSLSSGDNVYVGFFAVFDVSGTTYELKPFASSYVSDTVDGIWEVWPANDGSVPVPGSVTVGPTGTSGELQITWSWAGATLGVGRFETQYRLSGGGGTPGLDPWTPGGEISSLGANEETLAGGLIDGTEYEAQVRAVVVTSNGEFTGDWSTSAYGAPHENVPPGLPTNLINTGATSSSLDLTWDAPGDVGDGLDSYFVYLNSIQYDSVAAPTTTYTFTGLDVDTEYTIGVSSSGPGGASSVVPITASTTI